MFLLDLRRDICPMTFVKTTLALEKLLSGECLEIHLSLGEAVTTMPRTLEEQGHKVLSRKEDQGSVLLVVEKK